MHNSNSPADSPTLPTTVADLTLLLPFAAPPAEVLPHLLKQSRAPALQALFSKAQTVAAEAHQEAWLPNLPHERWLLQQAGNAPSRSADLPIAAYLHAADYPEKNDTAAWYCLQPVHIHAARDHLVLLNPDQLQLSAEESAALREVARPVLEEMSATRDLSHPQRWYVGTENLPDLITASPARASGRNIDTWMPRNRQDDAAPDIARRWRKWQNEIQMMWFDHPVNRAREMRGAVPANSLWLYGGGQLPLRSAMPFRNLGVADTASPLLTGLGVLTGQTAKTYSRFDSQVPRGALVLCEQLSQAALQEDWSAWLAALAQLEKYWFLPIMAALQTKQLAKVDMVLCSDTHWAQWRIQAKDGWKFWRKQSLDAALHALLMQDAA